MRLGPRASCAPSRSCLGAPGARPVVACRAAPVFVRSQVRRRGETAAESGCLSPQVSSGTSLLTCSVSILIMRGQRLQQQHDCSANRMCFCALTRHAWSVAPLLQGASSFLLTPRLLALPPGKLRRRPLPSLSSSRRTVQRTKDTPRAQRMPRLHLASHLEQRGLPLGLPKPQAHKARLNAPPLMPALRVLMSCQFIFTAYSSSVSQHDELKFTHLLVF